MTDPTQTLDAVIEKLAARFPQADAITESTRLGESVVLDSLSMLELVMMLEEDFGLSLDHADLQGIETPADIASLIERKQPATG